jgi:hypothetical protein
MKNKIFLVSYFILIAFVFISFLGCPGAKRDELEFYRTKVDSLRNFVNSFIVDYNRMKYKSYIENQPFFVSELYHQYGNLFNQEDINLINNLLKLEQRPERVDRLERLKVFIYEKIVEKQTAGILDRYKLVKHYINYPSKKGNLKLDDLDELLSQEPNARKRKYLYNTNERFFDDLQRINLKLLRERTAVIIDTLHFNSYKQFASMVRQEDLSTFYKTVNDFISSTNDYYFSQLYELLRSKKFAAENLFAYDIPYLLTDTRLEKSFRSDSLKKVFLETYNTLNFKLDSLPNLKIELIDTKQKKSKLDVNLRSKGFEISIPDENYLIINQKGTQNNYELVFSEATKLFPSLFTTEKIFEFNYFGGDIIPLTYKNLFSNLFNESEFVNQKFFHSNKLTSEFLKLRSFRNLYLVRKLCADFIVEYMMIDSLQTDPDSLVQIYNSILGYNLTGGDKLRLFLSLNDYYYEADLLKSIFIEALMKTRIREKFGAEWFKNPELNQYLLKFIERGRFLTKDKFLVAIGYYNLDPRFFFNEIISMKEKSKLIRQR